MHSTSHKKKDFNKGRPPINAIKLESEQLQDRKQSEKGLTFNCFPPQIASSESIKKSPSVFCVLLVASFLIGLKFTTLREIF